MARIFSKCQSFVNLSFSLLWIEGVILLKSSTVSRAFLLLGSVFEDDPVWYTVPKLLTHKGSAGLDMKQKAWNMHQRDVLARNRDLFVLKECLFYCSHATEEASSWAAPLQRSIPRLDVLCWNIHGNRQHFSSRRCQDPLLLYNRGYRNHLLTNLILTPRKTNFLLSPVLWWCRRARVILFYDHSRVILFQCQDHLNHQGWLLSLFKPMVWWEDNFS